MSPEYKPKKGRPCKVECQDHLEDIHLVMIAEMQRGTAEFGSARWKDGQKIRMPRITEIKLLLVR